MFEKIYGLWSMVQNILANPASGYRDPDKDPDNSKIPDYENRSKMVKRKQISPIFKFTVFKIFGDKIITKTEKKLQKQSNK